MSMALGMKPLHQHLGVEISGLRLDAAIDDETVASLWQVLDEHSLLVIREHPLADDDLLGLSRRMGRPDGGVRRYRSQGPAASAATPSRWHSHGEIKATGPALLCVSSLNECPTEGGEIEFAAVRAAYDELGAQRKEALNGLMAVHRFGAIAHGGGPGSNAAVRQPLVRTDPVTGRRGLFVGYHAVEVEGMPDEQGRHLLAELHALATDTRFVYRHQWRPGDLLLWDLCALLHHTYPVRSASNRSLHEVIVASRQSD